LASPRDANTVFVALNNWQPETTSRAGEEHHRGRTFTSVTGNLPDRHDVWSVVQDHVKGDLLFAGTEFGVFTSVDGGQKWVQLKGGIPVAQARDMTVQKREGDLVVGTFGRGFYVLDDYSPLRELAVVGRTPLVCRPPVSAARCLPVQNGWRRRARGHRSQSGNWTAPNPYGAVFPTGEKLRRRQAGALTDDTGKQIASWISTSVRLAPLAWNLRGETPQNPPTGRGGFGGGGRGGPAASRAGPLPRHDARVAGDKVTPVGQPQSFSVLPIELK
jgi:hypothetical protein